MDGRHGVWVQAVPSIRAETLVTLKSSLQVTVLTVLGTCSLSAQLGRSSGHD